MRFNGSEHHTRCKIYFLSAPEPKHSGSKPKNSVSQPQASGSEPQISRSEPQISGGRRKGLGSQRKCRSADPQRRYAELLRNNFRVMLKWKELSYIFQYIKVKISQTRNPTCAIVSECVPSRFK